VAICAVLTSERLEAVLYEESTSKLKRLYPRGINWKTFKDEFLQLSISNP